MATPTSWNKFTVAQLKEELTKRGLETPGKKAELVERLITYEKGKLVSKEKWSENAMFVERCYTCIDCHQSLFCNGLK